tara:strand:+ start:947 stop:1381 length:435 start_codon:yes stop_codon:yes gene_type:complete
MAKITRILIMGLPGSGKTTLARKVVKSINADWLNADQVRGKFKDWDFSKNGIIRQVKRMRELANKSKKKFVLADFICPIEEQFKIFKPHYVVWMDTIKKSRYKKINKIFKEPKKYNLRVTTKNSNFWKIPIIKIIKQHHKRKLF